MNGALSAIGSVAMAIVGLAILAVIVSKGAQTAGVITSAGNAFAGSIKAAVEPVTQPRNGR